MSALVRLRFSLFLFFLAGCQLEEPSKPIANFTVTGQNCTGPCSVSFTDVSENTSVYSWTYLWDFGDGSTSPERNPSHVYSKAGAFPVKFSLSGKYGSDSHTDTVRIESIPVLTADFSFEQDSSKVDSTIVKFLNLSKNAVKYKWNFGDKKEDTIASPVHKYKKLQTDSSYVVTLKATDKAGIQATKVDTILIRKKKTK